MSILGYSTSYFLPEYWANTPLYGEKIIPLLDYILSMDYEGSEKLAQAYYNITNKYKGITDLPVGIVEEIIDESGYSYVKALLGNNEESLRLLLTLMVLVHQLKGTKLGIEVVLNLLRRDNSVTVMQMVGDVVVDEYKNASNFSEFNYILFKGFTANGNDVEINFTIGGFNINRDQCLLSSSDYGIYIGVDTAGHLVMALSSNRTSWDILSPNMSTRTLNPGTEYHIRFVYSDYDYALQVSTDGKVYETWISQESDKLLGIHDGTLYLGIDDSTGVKDKPFSGYINFSDFSINVDNLEIVQWFEQTPVGPEDTFIIKTDVDVTLVTTAFFANFANFVKNYVYPTLEAFTAGLAFQGSVTLLPYVREKVTYIAHGDVTISSAFLVKETEQSPEATDPYKVVIPGGHEQYEVVRQDGD